MNYKAEILIELIDCYFSNPAPTSSDTVVDFLNLLFNPTDVIQIKEKMRQQPIDAMYSPCSKIHDEIAALRKVVSADGIQFCSNAVPRVFLDRLDEIYRYEATGQSQFDRLAAQLAQDLSLTCDLFDVGRTFFVEADHDTDGNPIETVAARTAYLQALIDAKLPISYIIDSGGRGPHVGIVLDQPISRIDFDSIIRNVLARLPSWMDTAVGRVNQLERFPGTSRVNKRGQTVPVNLIYLGQRVAFSDLRTWIESNLIINEEALKRVSYESELQQSSEVDPADAEVAAWKFITDNNLKHARSILRDKIQVSCPNAQNHRSGRDSNMSAFIKVSKGFIWCSACQKAVGRTFNSRLVAGPRPPTLIPSADGAVDADAIIVRKLF